MLWRAPRAAPRKSHLEIFINPPLIGDIRYARFQPHKSTQVCSRVLTFNNVEYFDALLMQFVK